MLRQDRFHREEHFGMERDHLVSRLRPRVIQADDIAESLAPKGLSVLHRSHGRLQWRSGDERRLRIPLEQPFVVPLEDDNSSHRFTPLGLDGA